MQGEVEELRQEKSQLEEDLQRAKVRRLLSLDRSSRLAKHATH